MTMLGILAQDQQGRRKDLPSLSHMMVASLQIIGPEKTKAPGKAQASPGQVQAGCCS